MNNEEWSRRLLEEIPRLRRYARALTQNPAAADDLVQDCLERGWEKRHTWRENTKLRPWLFSIMHNRFINIVRREKRAGEYLRSIGGQGELACSDMGYIIRDLEYGLSRMRPDFREVVLLAGLEGLSYKEIAEVVDIPVGTVMSRLSRGREELRGLMSEHKSSKVVSIK